MLVNDDRSRRRRIGWVGAIAGLILVAFVGAAALVRGATSAALQVVALGSDGRFGADVELAAPAPGETGIPLVIAVTNQGRRAVQPGSLTFAFPAWLRLVDAGGREFAFKRSEADPLVRVTLDLEGELFEPGVFPVVPAGFDQLRLESVLGSTDCSLSWRGVPELRPAPPWDVGTLSRVAIYWTFDGAAGRQSGLLALRVPAESLQPAPSDMRFGEPVVHDGPAPRPDVGVLSLEYSVAATCGEPEYPLELFTVAWRSEAGGLFIVVSHLGQPRLHLFDLDDDGIIELEIRDSDGNGEFESRRPVSFAIPAFLAPRPGNRTR